MDVILVWTNPKDKKPFCTVYKQTLQWFGHNLTAVRLIYSSTAYAWTIQLFSFIISLISIGCVIWSHTMMGTAVRITQRVCFCVLQPVCRQGLCSGQQTTVFSTCTAFPEPHSVYMDVLINGALCIVNCFKTVHGHLVFEGVNPNESLAGMETWTALGSNQKPFLSFLTFFSCIPSLWGSFVDRLSPPSDLASPVWPCSWIITKAKELFSVLSSRVNNHQRCRSL